MVVLGTMLAGSREKFTGAYFKVLIASRLFEVNKSIKYFSSFIYQGWDVFEYSLGICGVA